MGIIAWPFKKNLVAGTVVYETLPMSQHPIRVLVWVLDAPLSIQLHDTAPGIVAEDGQCVWIPGTHVGNVEEVPGSWLKSAQFCSCGHLGADEWYSLSLYYSSFQINLSQSRLVFLNLINLWDTTRVEIFKKCLFSEQFCVHSSIGRKVESLYPFCPPLAQPPPLATHCCQSATPATITENPTNLHRPVVVTQSPSFPIEFTFVAVYSMNLCTGKYTNALTIIVS